MKWSEIRKALLFVIVSLILVLTGCRNTGDQSIFYHSGKSAGEELKGPPKSAQGIVPLQMNFDAFRFVVGWLSNDEVLITEAKGDQDVVFSYHLKNGKRNNRYYSDHSIISASISPSKRYLFIHSSPSSYEASIQIFNLETNELTFETTLQSSEIHFEWNKYNEESPLLVTFYEDWTFTPYILHIGKGKIETVNLPHPFVNWFGEDSWLSLNWDDNHPSMTAPLVIYGKDQVKSIFSGKKFYYVDQLNGVYFTIGVSENDEGKAEFFFFDRGLKPLLTFQVPHLSTFSGWQIPHYDFISETKDFMMIEPVNSGEADIYQGGFQLVKRNVFDGGQRVIMDDIENAPLSCSPDGKYCLTGKVFEKIIDLKTRKITEFLLF